MYLIAALLMLALARLGFGKLSTAVARYRFAQVRGQRLAYRDTATAPAVDLDLDLSRATGEQLTDQRTALLHRISNPEDGDDTAVLASRAREVAEAITAHNARVADAQAARQALLGGEVVRTSRPGPVAAPEGEQRNERVTLARSFLQSEAFRSYDGHGRMQTVVVPGEVRALFDSADFPSANTRVPGVVQPDRDTPLTILDLIDRQPMESQTVEWVKETGYPDDAAEVAEGSAKQETTAAFELVTSAAAIIAHFINITRSALQDESMMRGYIEGRLTYGVLRRLNAQVLNGDGSSPNLRGILNTSGIGSYTAASGEAAVISIRKAKTVAQLSEYEPDAVVVNPVDWERVEISTTTDGVFRVNPNVSAALQPRIWGMNVVVTTNITGTDDGVTGGTFLVGGFREGATLWERTGVELYITDSHASNFTSNILTLLAEMRAALSVWRPKAFVKGTFSVSESVSP